MNSAIIIFFKFINDCYYIIYLLYYYLISILKYTIRKKQVVFSYFYIRNNDVILSHAEQFGG